MLLDKNGNRIQKGDMVAWTPPPRTVVGEVVELNDTIISGPEAGKTILIVAAFPMGFAPNVVQVSDLVVCKVPDKDATAGPSLIKE